jgi:hypothetical protein
MEVSWQDTCWNPVTSNQRHSEVEHLKASYTGGEWTDDSALCRPERAGACGCTWCTVPPAFLILTLLGAQMSVTNLKQSEAIQHLLLVASCCRLVASYSAVLFLIVSLFDVLTDVHMARVS